MADIPPLGSYGVTATGGWAGWFIRLGTFSRYNHAFIVGPNGVIVEANPTGAEIGHISQYPKARYNLHTSLPDATREQIWRNAEALLGTKYGWLDILALSLRFFGLRWGWIEARIKRQDRLICSQLVTLAYARAGVHLFDDGRLAQDVNPGDLADILAD
jgi:cell wall-associated NlpC family hydrolase